MGEMRRAIEQVFRRHKAGTPNLVGIGLLSAFPQNRTRLCVLKERFTSAVLPIPAGPSMRTNPGPHSAPESTGTTAATISPARPTDN